MIYKFRFLSADEENFICEIEIDSEQTFFVLHKTIQNVMKFDKSHLASFYLCNTNWEKEQEISLLDMGNDSNQLFFMDKCVLKDFLTHKPERLIYVFDLLNERGFFIELVAITGEMPNKKYPVCTKLEGKIPTQILIDNSEFEM